MTVSTHLRIRNDFARVSSSLAKRVREGEREAEWRMLTDDESKPETDPIIGRLFLRAPFCTPFHTFSGSSCSPQTDKIPSSFVTMVWILIHVLSDKIARIVGFVNFFLRVPVVYLPCCPLSRQAEGTYRKKCAQSSCMRYFVT